MNQIIDVEYRTLTPLDDKTTEQLTVETNKLWQQIEFIGNYGTLLAAQAGARLNVIKSRLGHGQWENWMKENLEFSPRKANSMMKLAEKMADENSIFSKTQTLADIGISKVWALLGAPEEVAEEVMANPAAQEMSVRDRQDEIKRLKEENAGLKQKESDDKETICGLEDMLKEADVLQKHTEDLKDRNESILQKQIQQLEEQLKVYSETPAGSPEQDAEIARLQKELENVRANLGKEREKSKALKDSVEEAKKLAAAEAAEQAKQEARTEFEEESRLLTESNRQAAAEIDRLQKLQNGSQDVAEFKVKSDMLQQNFLACMSSIRKVAEYDTYRAEKMRHALRKVMDGLLEKLEV